MYKLDEEKSNVVEIDLHPISKWKRILLYLGDMFLSFIAAILFMSLIVMPIASIFVKPKTQEAVAAEHVCDDILYEHKLLFYKTPEGTGLFPKYNFDADLRYTYNRFLAFYVFDTDTSLDPEYPDYCHKIENEVIYTYYHDIKYDDITYYDLFNKHAARYNLFDITDTSIALKADIKEVLVTFYKPGEKLGSKGQEYYDNISDLFSALYSMVIKDIKVNDLTDTAGNSYIKNQALISEISKNYYGTVALCAGISYLLGWLIIHIVYPLINSNGRTPTMSIMRVDRLGYRNLIELSKKEVALLSSYFVLLDMPYMMFLSLSYTTMLYILKVPALPILSIISLLTVIVSLFIILFNPFNRSLSDLLSQSVMVSSQEVDGIIKAKETIEELKVAEERNKK